MADTGSERHETVRLEDYLRILRDRLWIIIPCVLVVTLVVLFSSIRTTPMYKATAEVVYDPRIVGGPVLGNDFFGFDYNRPRTIETAIAAISRNRTIAEGVQTRLGSEAEADAGLSADQLSGMVSASASGDTDIVTISATSSVPSEAAAVANAFAYEFITFRGESRRALLREAQDLYQSRIQSLSPSERSSDSGLLLQAQYEGLVRLEILEDGDFYLQREAEVPGAAFTPQTGRDVTLAVVLGLVLGVGLAFLLEYLDKRVKDERTLERLSGLPVLASVPVVGRSWRRGRNGARSLRVVGFSGDKSPLLESFRALRSSLQYFNVDDNLRKILVTSGLPLEGKTVTTANLAISLAMSGKRVIVLEADLRRPMVHEYLNLDNQVGLSNVLAGSSSVPGAIQLVDMEPLLPSKSRGAEKSPSALLMRKNLYCMTSGPLPPNPTELLQSARMADVISELENLADYLLIDTPPVLPVSDALALAPQADAVILAARLHSTTRGELEQVREVLKRTDAHVIGLVAGGVKVGRSHYYRRGYRYRYGDYQAYNY